jgi:hypothetical protein
MDTVVDNLGLIGQYIRRIAVMGMQVIKGLAVIAILYIVMFAIWGGYKSFRNHLKSMVKFETTLICIPAIISFLIICIIAPYVAIRYIYQLVPFVVVPIGYFFDYAITQKEKNRSFIAAAIIVAVIWSLVYPPSYTYESYETENEMISEYSTSPCVYITDNTDPSITSSINELLYFKDVCVIDKTDSYVLSDYMTEYKGKNEMILFIAEYPEKRNNDSLIESLCDKYGYNETKKIAERDFSNIYLLSQQ